MFFKTTDLLLFIDQSQSNVSTIKDQVGNKLAVKDLAIVDIPYVKDLAVIINPAVKYSTITTNRTVKYSAFTINRTVENAAFTNNRKVKDLTVTTIFAVKDLAIYTNPPSVYHNTIKTNIYDYLVMVEGLFKSSSLSFNNSNSQHRSWSVTNFAKLWFVKSFRAMVSITSKQIIQPTIAWNETILQSLPLKHMHSVKIRPINKYKTLSKTRILYNKLIWDFDHQDKITGKQYISIREQLKEHRYDIVYLNNFYTEYGEK